MNKKFSLVIFLHILLFVFIFTEIDAKSVLNVESVEGLTPPSIFISPEYFYPAEEVLYIEGRAMPGAAIDILIQKIGDQPFNFTVRANPEGEWTLTEKINLREGVYEIRVRQYVEGAYSDWSDSKNITSILTGIQIFGLNMLYKFLASIVVSILLLSILTLFYFWWKIRKLKQWVKGG